MDNASVVLLESGTVGIAVADTVTIGCFTEVWLHDENGMPISEIGIVVEILS